MADFVFLHGGGQGGWIWEETIAALAVQSGGTARTLATDVIGCGSKRGRDASAMSLDDVAADIAAEIVEEGLSDIVLVGHSQAGSILPRVAGALPAGAVRRAVFVSCVAPVDGEVVTDAMLRMHADRRDEEGKPFTMATLTTPEGLRAMFCNDMAGDDADLFMARLGFDAWPHCAHTETAWPLTGLDGIGRTFVVCLQDRAIPPSWQLRFAQDLAADRLVHIDAGHQVQNTRPHGLAEILLAEAAL